MKMGRILANLSLEKAIELVRKGYSEKNHGNTKQAQAIFIRASRMLEGLLENVKGSERLLVIKLLEKVNREIKELEKDLIG